MKYNKCTIKSSLKPALILLLLWSCRTLFAFNGTYDEYTFKAVYFGKIALFTNWPEKSHINDRTEPFVIGIIGKTPLREKLLKIYQYKKIRNKDVMLISVESLSDIDRCHILFIPDSEQDNLADIIKHTEKTPVLTIADTKGFSQQGVIMNIIVGKNGSHQLEVNQQAESKSEISISSKLLKYATIINSEKRR